MHSVRVHVAPASPVFVSESVPFSNYESERQPGKSGPDLDGGIRKRAVKDGSVADGCKTPTRENELEDRECLTEGVQFAIAVAKNLCEDDIDPDFLLFKDVLRWTYRSKRQDYDSVQKDFFSILRRQPRYESGSKTLALCLLDLFLVGFAWLSILIYCITTKRPWGDSTANLKAREQNVRVHSRRHERYHAPWQSLTAMHAHIGSLIIMAASVLRFPPKVIRALSDGYEDSTCNDKHKAPMALWVKYVCRLVVFVLLAVVFAGPVGAIVLWNKTDAMKTDLANSLNVTGLEIVGPIVLGAIVCLALTYDAVVSGDAYLRKYQASLVRKWMTKTVEISEKQGGTSTFQGTGTFRSETVSLSDAVGCLYSRQNDISKGSGCCTCKSSDFLLKYMPKKSTIFALLCPIPVVLYPGLTRLIWYHDGFFPNQLNETSYRVCLSLSLITTYACLAVLCFLMADTYSFLVERNRATKALFDAIIPPHLPSVPLTKRHGQYDICEELEIDNTDSRVNSEQQLRFNFGFANNMDAWSRLFIFVQSHKHKELKRAESVVSCIIAIIAILAGVLIYYRWAGQLDRAEDIPLGAWTVSSVSLYATFVLGGFLLFPTLYLGVSINECITQFGAFTVPMIKWRITTIESIRAAPPTTSTSEVQDESIKHAMSVSNENGDVNASAKLEDELCPCKDSGRLFELLDAINALVSSPTYIFRILYVPLNGTSLKALMTLIAGTTATTVWNMVSAGKSAA